MSLLGKYRKEEDRREDDEEKPTATSKSTTSARPSSRVTSSPSIVAVPNKERKSPIIVPLIKNKIPFVFNDINASRINLLYFV